MSVLTTLKFPYEYGELKPTDKGGKDVEGIGKKDGVKVWYFNDGSTMPLDAFIAKTKANLKSECGG